MPVPRPAVALRAANTLSATTKTSSALAPANKAIGSSIRTFSSTATRPAAEHAHEDHYDPPSGWLWGVKPGEKPEREGWEGVFMYGFFGSLGLGAVAYAFKPDTSIQTWALEEARRRLEVEGILPEPESKS